MASGLAVEDGSARDLADKHFLQAHGLGAKLELVRSVRSGGAALVFDREGQVSSLFPLQWYACRVPTELHHVACADESEPRRRDAQAANDQHISPPFPRRGVVGFSMERAALHRPDILRPLVFNVNQRPLPAAKAKMLDPRNQKAVVLIKFH